MRALERKSQMNINVYSDRPRPGALGLNLILKKCVDIKIKPVF